MAGLFRKRLDDELADTPWTPSTILILVVILVCFSGLFTVVYRSSRRGAFRPEYSGTVVEKWAKYNETEQGSQPLFRLLLEGDNNTRFVVVVDDNTYYKARPGMKITKTPRGIVWETSDLKENSVRR